jgi:uncharacterized membrane protein YgdD (TMEM256/DUF423 family)
MTTTIVWLRAGIVLAALAVAAGAFGAHALRGRLGPRAEEEARAGTPAARGVVPAARRMEVFETGVRYHFYHALALVAVGLFGLTPAAGRTTALEVAGWAFSVGIVLFSGSLYGLALTGIAALGAVPVLGGVAFLAGWGAFLAATLR